MNHTPSTEAKALMMPNVTFLGENEENKRKEWILAHSGGYWGDHLHTQQSEIANNNWILGHSGGVWNNSKG